MNNNSENEMPIPFTLTYDNDNIEFDEYLFPNNLNL